MSDVYDDVMEALEAGPQVLAAVVPIVVDGESGIYLWRGTVDIEVALEDGERPEDLDREVRALVALQLCDHARQHYREEYGK